MINKTKYWRILLIVFLLPLLFINVKDSHDWGDDFAQYLIQARNIIENKPQTENGLIFPEGSPLYAIEAYPAGFPIMLAPVYVFSGLHLSPYMILLSVFLIATGIICFEYFSRHENAIIAFLIAMLFCYNPTILDLKKQILSEIPFTCLLMLSLLWPLCKWYNKKFSWLITGMIFGYLMSLRVIGVIVVGAYVLTEINRLSRNKEGKSWMQLILTVGSSLFFFFLINTFIFSIHAYSLFGFYFDAVKSNSIHSAINFDYYYDVLKNFFPFWSISISAVWLLTAFAGWLIRFIKFRTLAEYFFPLYLLVIVFYPYSSAGYRLLIPILPLLIFYLYYFLSWLFYWFGKKQHKITPALLTLFLLAYIPTVYSTIKNQKSVENGPQQKDATEMFDFLKTIPADVPVIFPRARAMYLYSGHSSMYPLVNQDSESVLADIKKMKNVLIVVSIDSRSQVYEKKLLEFVKRYEGEFEKVWGNDGFEVLEKKN